MTTGTITGAASEQYEAASTDAIRRFRIHVPDETLATYAGAPMRLASALSSSSH